MKAILIVFILAGCSGRHHNISDFEDKNAVPAHLENREEEVINRPDELDGNKTLDILEEREKEEERRQVFEPPVFD